MNPALIYLISFVVLLPTMANANFYAAVTVGTAKHSVEGYSKSSYVYDLNGDLTSSNSQRDLASNDNTESLGARLGYQFNDYFSSELTYQRYGEAQGANLYGLEGDKYDVVTLEVGIKASLPLSDNWSLFARTGLSAWQVDNGLTDLGDISGYSTPNNHEGNDVYYGIGAEYSLTENISLSVEYSMLSMDWKDFHHAEGDDSLISSSITSDSSTDYSIENLSLILQYAF